MASPRYDHARRTTDHALGQLEVAVMHSRNAFREIVASDDLDANAQRIGGIATLLGPIERIAKSLHTPHSRTSAATGG